MTYPLGSTVTANINLRTDKFNIFNTTGVRDTDRPGNAQFNNTYLGDQVNNPLSMKVVNMIAIERGSIPI